MTDYTAWGLRELVEELERRDREAIDAFQKGTPLDGSITCIWCGKDIFPDAEGYCPDCETYPV